MPDIIKEDITICAEKAGFDLAGVTAAAVLDGEFLHTSLNAGRHAGMDYMARNVEKRLDPGKLVPGTRSIICVGAEYYLPGKTFKDSCGGEIARYAWGDDYHRVLKKRLRLMADELTERLGRGFQYRCFVDTAPVMEKTLAARAGLGWIGKNTLLLNKTYGSWFLLGELFTDLELETDGPLPDGCGDCRRCVEACPAGALLEPYILDARKCISYLNQYEWDTTRREALRGWRWGCDICQEACPYNRQPRPARLAEFKTQSLEIPRQSQAAKDNDIL